MGTTVAAIVLLAERFPARFFVYEGRRRPLKIGIHNDRSAITVMGEDCGDHARDRRENPWASVPCRALLPYGARASRRVHPGTA